MACCVLPKLGDVLLLSLLLINSTIAFVLKNRETPVTGRILCFFVTDNVDSFRYHLNLAELLVHSGYNVTVLGVLPLPMPFKESSFIYQRLDRIEIQSEEYPSTRLHTFIDNWYQYRELDKNFDNFLQNHELDEFDLVILAYYQNTKHLQRAGCFRRPIILSTDTWSDLPNNWELGDLGESTYLSNFYGSAVKRTNNILNIFRYLYMEKAFELLLDAAHFVTYMGVPKKASYFKCPAATLDEVRRNISLIFTNHHITQQGSVRPNMPAIVSISGIQIPDKPTTLPPHIARFLDKSQHGVIYINLGTNSNCTQATSRAYELLYSVLTKMHVEVLWIWSGCLVGQQNTKILFEKWVPQNDVLAHPNVELFITHGGLTSISEAQYHGVPMLALPFHANQIDNVENMVRQGFGLSVNPYSASFDEIQHKLSYLIFMPEFKNNIKKFASIYRDRPLAPQQTVLYWVDYVLRYNGAQHLRSLTTDVNQLEVVLLDWFLPFLVMALSLVLLSCYYKSKGKGKLHKNIQTCIPSVQMNLNASRRQLQNIEENDKGSQVQRLEQSSEHKQQSNVELTSEPKRLAVQMESELKLEMHSIPRIYVEEVPESEMESKEEQQPELESESEPENDSEPEMEPVSVQNVEEQFVIERVLTRSQKRRNKKKQKQKQNQQNVPKTQTKNKKK